MILPFRRPAGLGCLALFVLMLLASACSGGGASEGMAAEMVSPLVKYLPASGEVPGWTLKDAGQAFEGDDLFQYIDGGAEVYHEYGFARALVQDFRRGEAVISLEIFEMATPAAAFGIYTFKRGPGGEPAAIGAGSSLEGYYLNFWKGRCLVTLTASNSSAAAVQGLMAVGRVVAGRIENPGEPPALAGALPREGLSEASLKYLRGPLAFYNVCPFFARDVLTFREGVKGDYAAGYSAMALRCGGADAARDALARVSKAAGAEPEKYRRLSMKDMLLGFEHEGGGAVRIERRGALLLMAWGGTPSAADAGLAALRAARISEEID